MAEIKLNRRALEAIDALAELREDLQAIAASCDSIKTIPTGQAINSLIEELEAAERSFIGQLYQIQEQERQP